MPPTAAQTPPAEPQPERPSMIEPFRTRMFRRLWITSMLANMGMLIQGVGSAWTMTKLTDNTEMVALVQTALTLPMMVFAIPAGALSDMLDRRKVAIVAVLISGASACVLTGVELGGLLTPWLLLMLCFAIGSGFALFGPAWQASVMEVVSRRELPQAIALNAISFNFARAVGPAVGGFIIAGAGAIVTFGLNAVLYLPLLFVLLVWRRELVPNRMPPESLGRAIASGGRYVINSPTIRGVLIRCFLTGLASASILALLPVIARDHLGGGPQVFGFCLGAYGLGAITSAFLLPRLRFRFEAWQILTGGSTLLGLSIALMGATSFLPLSLIALLAAGAAWMIIATGYNISIQLSSPRWITARAVATFQASISGGVAVGSWFWGLVAHHAGLSVALFMSAAATLATVWGVRALFPANEAVVRPFEEVELPPLEVEVSNRSGPILIEIEYRVEPARAREFYRLMQTMRASRARLGAYGWLIARDISDPSLWTERFHWPTWLDYLRHRTRHTTAERELQDAVRRFHTGDEPMRVRRFLERPYGSVRWREDAPDPKLDEQAESGLTPNL